MSEQNWCHMTNVIFFNLRQMLGIATGEERLELIASSMMEYYTTQHSRLGFRTKIFHFSTEP